MVLSTHLGSHNTGPLIDPWHTLEMLALPWIGRPLYSVDPGYTNMTYTEYLRMSHMRTLDSKYLDWMDGWSLDGMDVPEWIHG